MDMSLFVILLRGYKKNNCIYLKDLYSCIDYIFLKRDIFCERIVGKSCIFFKKEISRNL